MTSPKHSRIQLGSRLDPESKVLREAPSPGRMFLFAAGFNAWNQLVLGDSQRQVTPDSEPEDITTFTNVLEDESLGAPKPSLYNSIVPGHSRFYAAGAGIDVDNEGDLYRIYTACQAGNGLILTFESSTTGSAKEKGDRGGSHSSSYLTLHSPDADFEANKNPRRWECKSPVREIAAFAAGFLILYQDGTVATLGDPRYQNCLAREVTPDSPADEPHLVPDVVNLGERIKHVTAGGYALAALTESGSVYVWGCNSPGDHGSRNAMFVDLCAIPNYWTVDEDKDITDVALGDSHAIALTKDGDVYVIGRNKNGQLGLGLDRNAEVKTWTKATLDIPADQHVVRVAAGPRCSFILVAGEPETR